MLLCSHSTRVPYMNGMYHLLCVCRLGYPLSCSRLTWYGHVLGRRICRQESDEGAGGKRRGRPKRRWLDNIKNTPERYVSGEEAQDRAKWRRLIRNIDPT